MPNFKEIINHWFGMSALSQVKNITRSGNIYWKCFWFAVFVVTLGIGLWKGYGEVQKYLSVSSFL
jgi:hypothetical protein